MVKKSDGTENSTKYFPYSSPPQFCSSEKTTLDSLISSISFSNWVLYKLYAHNSIWFINVWLYVLTFSASVCVRAHSHIAPRSFFSGSFENKLLIPCPLTTYYFSVYFLGTKISSYVTIIRYLIYSPFAIFINCLDNVFYRIFLTPV